MSSIAFSSPNGSARLRGPERAHADQLTKRMAIAAIDYDGLPSWTGGKHDPLIDMALDYDFTIGFERWLRWGDGFRIPDDPTLLAKLPQTLQDKVEPGMRVPMFGMILNTALVGGSDPVKLLARLHGQCEANAWIDGPNRAWLAEIAREGLASCILRTDMGWDDVIAFLESSQDEPVVTSFSVTRGFPYQPGNFKSEKKWYKLSAGERWKLALDDLKANPWMEIKPDNWKTYYFDYGVNAHEIRLIAYLMGKAREVTA